jgi:hypothetical protein
MKIADLREAAMEWTVTIEGPDEYGEVQRAQVQIEKGFDKLTSGENIADLEAKIANLRIAERELEALDAAPAPRRKSKAKTKRKPKTDAATEAPQTVGAAITDVLSRTGALPLAELAEQIRTAGREVSGGTLSNRLQTMKKRGAVTRGGGKWMLPKAHARRARA